MALAPAGFHSHHVVAASSFPVMEDAQCKFVKTKRRNKKTVRLEAGADTAVTAATAAHPVISLKQTFAINADALSGACLVDSPRRIILEKTTLGVQSPIASHLETFYNNTVYIADEQITTVQDDVIELLDYIRPRMKKFGRKLGLKFGRFVPIGSVFDRTDVIGINDIDILFELDKDRTNYHNISPGYKYIPLKKWKEVEGGKPDPFRFGRSKDGSYLSSLTVARNVNDLIERSLKMRSDACVLPQCDVTDCAQVTILFKGQYRVNVIPAIYHAADDNYLVTRSYVYDANPASDCSWRINHVSKERTIIHLMDSADRGVRLKAYKMLKALTQLEPTLQGIPSYHVKTVLFHTFDDCVDHMPRWQRTSVDACFFRLMNELRNFYALRCLPNFFLRRHNLLEHMPPRLIARYKARLTFLLANQREFLRVLNKRSVVVLPVNQATA